MSSQPESATSILQFPPTPERLLNSREVAEWLGVSLDWVQAHARGKKIPRIPAVLLGAGRHGRQMLRFRREDVESSFSITCKIPLRCGGAPDLLMVAIPEA